MILGNILRSGKIGRESAAAALGADLRRLNQLLPRSASKNSKMWVSYRRECYGNLHIFWSNFREVASS